MYIDGLNAERVRCGTNKETGLFEEIPDSVFHKMEKLYHPTTFLIPRFVFERYQGIQFYPQDHKNRFKNHDELETVYSFCYSRRSWNPVTSSWSDYPKCSVIPNVCY